MADCMFVYLGRIAYSLCSQCIVFYGDCGYGFVFIGNLNNLKSIRNVRWNIQILSTYVDGMAYGCVIFALTILEFDV